MKHIFSDKEWDAKIINSAYDECRTIAEEELKLSYYTNQIEIVDSYRMLDVYSSIGLPIMYNHWSFGKHYARDSMMYKKGFTSLALELVINSNPCISYLMDENTAVQQTMVIAHACFGHNNFFKENWLFQQWTDPNSIVDYLVFAKKYISDCEEKYGFDEVERTLDACHALQDYGVHKYVKPVKLNIDAEKKKIAEREEYLQKQLNVLWSTIPHAHKKEVKEQVKFPEQPEENILYFLEQYSPKLKPWQREIIRIVRHISQYFYPQRQTKVMNEGWATFVHFYTLNRLYEKGLISDGAMLEFLHSHSSVVKQNNFDDKNYNGINPYALGFDIFKEVKRICENPTDEDREWCPDLIGADWVSTCHDIVKSYKDESFILQFLTPNLIRKWRLFSVVDDRFSNYYEVTDIHNDLGYKNIRKIMSLQNTIAFHEPDIQITDVDLLGDRTLHLKHYPYNITGLDLPSTEKVMDYIRYLWGYKVILESIDDDERDVVYEVDDCGSFSSEYKK